MRAEIKPTFRESTLSATNRPPSPPPEEPAPRGSHSGPPPNAPFEFYLSSAWQGLLWFLPLARIWFDLVQLKPDNKTPLYEIYLLSWILLPLIGIQLTRFLERFRPEGLSPALYHRIFAFLNFILVLAAYWDIQTSFPEPLLLELVIYLSVQAAGIYAARLLSDRQKWSSWLYPAMAALFLFWISRMDAQWEKRFHPGPLGLLLFIALAASVFFELKPQKHFNFKIGFWPYLLLAPFFAFLIINPDCSYCLFNHTYFVGPLADFVNGKTLLVDINAQYGVLLFFFLKLIFPALLPLGFHSFYFLDAVLRLGAYLIFFWIARGLFKSWLYPAICAVVLILLNCQTPPSLLWYPSQGVLRFGFIYILAALVMLRELHPGKAVWFLRLEALTAATAAFWSFEVCFYTIPPYLLFNAVEIFEAGGSPRDRVLDFIRRLIPLAAAALFILAFIYGFTWMRAGQLPHWNYYFDFVWLYREGFMMIDTPLVGLWWIPVGVLYLSCFFLLAVREKKPPHWNLLVLVLFYGIFQLFYYFGRSVDTNLYPLLMPSVLLFFYWFYALRVKTLFTPKTGWFSGAALFFVFLFYAAGPLLPTRLDVVHRPPLLETAQQFLKTSRDLPRDEAFAQKAEQLMEKYSGDQKYSAYFFGEKGVEVALYDGRSKIYPYDDIDQPSLSKPTLERILSTRPALKAGDYVYTSPEMDEPKPILGTSLNLEQTLLQQLNSDYLLRRVETSGTITVYKIAGEKRGSQSIQKATRR